MIFMAGFATGALIGFLTASVIAGERRFGRGFFVDDCIWDDVDDLDDLDDDE